MVKCNRPPAQSAGEWLSLAGCPRHIQYVGCHATYLEAISFVLNLRKRHETHITFSAAI
jgi:hypothetical protein